MAPMMDGRRVRRRQVVWRVRLESGADCAPCPECIPPPPPPRVEPPNFTVLDFVWSIAGAGMGEGPRGRSSACEQRDYCPTLMQ